MFKFNTVASSDNGNGNLKMFINGVYIELPNVMYFKGQSVPDTGDWGIDRIKDLSNNLLVSIEEKEENFLGQEEIQENLYYLGSYPLRNGYSVVGLDIADEKNKTTNKLTIMGTIGQLAAEAVREQVFAIEDEKNKDISDENERVAFALEDMEKLEDIEIVADFDTSLPVRVYSKDLAIELAKKFKKEHKLKIYLPDNKSLNVSIKFNKINVIPEGVTASYFLANAPKDVFTKYKKDYNEELTSDFFKKDNNIMHVAIGAGTTEFPRTIGYSWLGEFKTGTNNGIRHALKKAILELEKIDGTEAIRNETVLGNIIVDIFENAEGRTKHRFEPEILKAISAPLSIQANEIFETIRAELNAPQQVDLVVVYGGGSILLENLLKKRLEELEKKKRFRTLYIPKEYAVQLEVFGLYTLISSPSCPSLV